MRKSGAQASDRCCPSQLTAATGEHRRPTSEPQVRPKKPTGNTALVETTSAGYGEGRAAAPLADWKAQRLGANPPQTLARASRRCGRGRAKQPAAFRPHWRMADEHKAEGPSAERRGGASAWGRSNLRRGCVAQEMAFKLDVPGLRLHFEALGSADLAGKARAVGIFVKSGVPLARALEMAGLRG